MCRSLLFLISCSIWRLVYAAGSSGYLELEAISDDGWDGSLQRRESFMNSKVQLHENEHFVWGSPVDANQTVYVNMTMGTKDDELIISMERFTSQLKSVDCSEDLMAMTFNSNATYQHAILSWEWVNFSKNRTFVMVSSYPGCGKDSSRSPWVVYNAYYDPENLRVELNATQKAWEDVAHTYSLDFGRYAPPAPATQNASLAKRWTFDKSFPLDLNYELPSTLFNGISTSDFDLTVGCPGCGTTGQLVLAGHVEVKFFGGLKAFTVSATPQGIGAALNLDVKVGGELPVGGFMESVNLASLDLGGFSIPGIMTLGPTFNIDAGFGLSSLSGSATFSAGVSASIPDSSTAEVDLTGKSASSVTGWQPEFKTQPLSVDAQLAATIDVYTKLSVAASVLVLGNGFSVSLGLKVPDVSMTASASINESGGTCPGSIKIGGVALDASIGAVLELQGYTEVLGTKSMFLNNPLFNSGAAFTFQPVCFPFGPNAVPAVESPASYLPIPAATVTSLIPVSPVPATEASYVSATATIPVYPKASYVSATATVSSYDADIQDAVVQPAILTSKTILQPTYAAEWNSAINPSVPYYGIGPGSEFTSSLTAAASAVECISTSVPYDEVGPGSDFTTCLRLPSYDTVPESTVTVTVTSSVFEGSSDMTSLSAVTTTTTTPSESYPVIECMNTSVPYDEIGPGSEFTTCIEAPAATTSASQYAGHRKAVRMHNKGRGTYE